ncbi:MAG: 3-phosphoserine/phosphohydroxythreonine transaminase [Elusimicrobia bacterium]|nr:3-phosphoserine/phosphohydroxythreonine transaminase [Candidatus Obscuribacterium magneticum]
MTKRVFNFNPGPAALPQSVLEKAQAELVSFGNSGMSVMEMSHRAKDFEAILARAQASLKKLLGIPDNYAILFLGGGASLQFSMVPMNLYVKGKPVDMLHTGSWTEKAIKDLQKVGEMKMAASTEKDKFTRVPRLDEIKLDPNASYVYLCSNNTIEGTEYFEFPNTGAVPLVADMSSDILSHRIDVKQFGLIFAGAQKNLGPSGVTVVIIRNDLAERADKSLPTMLQYRTHIKENSLYNTPPCFNIYMVALVLEWVEKEGGLEAVEKRNIEKARILYDAIDQTGYYTCPVEKKDRSRMNVVFRVKGGNEALEEKFVAEAKAAGLVGLKGHRSVGGLRASIYNAHPVEGVKALASFMGDFEKKNG